MQCAPLEQGNAGIGRFSKGNSGESKIRDIIKKPSDAIRYRHTADQKKHEIWNILTNLSILQNLGTCEECIQRRFYPLQQ